MSSFELRIAGKGVENVLAELRDWPEATPRILSQAINKVADRERTASARALLGEYNWPRNYLAPSTGRLVVARRASESSPEAVIRARWQPTSLARFSAGQPGGPVKVGVRPGRQRTLKRAFFVRLRAGDQLTETRFNLGLAVRTDGPKPSAAFKPRKFTKNTWLVYGPSVASVFFRVSGQRSEETARALEAEFLRLLNLSRRAR